VNQASLDRAIQENRALQSANDQLRNQLQEQGTELEQLRGTVSEVRTAIRQRNAMVLRLAEQFGVDGAIPGEFAPYRSRVIWPPMMPQDDTADVRNNISLVEAGLRSHRTAMDNLGEESPEREMERVLQDRELMGEVSSGATDEAPNERQPVGRPREGGPGEDPAP
jgi:hypothetical protein